jgi:hypothetical protein
MISVFRSMTVETLRAENAQAAVSSKDADEFR